MHCTNFLLNWHTLFEEVEPVDTLTYTCNQDWNMWT